MSVCEHDRHCPGHGPDHDAALRGEPSRRWPMAWVFRSPVVTTVTNPNKDRSLRGKQRRRARKEAR